MYDRYIIITRTTHAYDASHHSKCPAARMGCEALVSEIARLVGVQEQYKRTVTWRVSLNTWLVKNLQYALSTIEIFLVLPSLYWLLRWADFSLATLPISGSHTAAEDFQKGLSRCSAGPGGAQWSLHMLQLGDSGVLNGVSIPFQHL